MTAATAMAMGDGCAYRGRFLSAQEAYALDQDLLAGVGCEKQSLEALMRRAGAQAGRVVVERAGEALGHKMFCVLCGPGNNGGDGLVLAVTLARAALEGVNVKVWYPKGPGSSALYAMLKAECEAETNIEFVDEAFVVDALERHVNSHDSAANVTCFVDALFGFSFKGDVREPFIDVMNCLTAATNGACADADERALYTVAIDIPSGWNVDGCDADDGKLVFMPNLLISLTAPKRCCATLDDPAKARHWRMKRMAQTHVVAGTFLTDAMCDKYGLHDVPLRVDSTIDFAPVDLSRRLD